jgi:hypothetical protein
VPAELTRDSGSMSLGTSLLWGSHHGSHGNGGKQCWQWQWQPQSKKLDISAVALCSST